VEQVQEQVVCQVLVEQEVNNLLLDQFRFQLKKWLLSQGYNP